MNKRSDEMKSKKAALYLDTSVINFLFADDAPEKKAVTIELFEKYINTGKYEAYVSDVVVGEIENTASAEKRALLSSAITDNR